MGRAAKEDLSCYASKAQQLVLGKISELALVSENFFLTGGTALSVFYLHHRVSEDIDLFSTHFQNLSSIDVILKRSFAEELVVVQSSSAFYSYLIGGIKIDLVFDPLSTEEKRQSVEIEGGAKVLVDTLDNIASNKLAAAASRSEPKDLIDIFFISQQVWSENQEENLRACYEMARRKEALLDDPATTAYQIELLYKRVLAQKEEILPPIRKPIDWRSFQENLRSVIETIYHMEKW